MPNEKKNKKVTSGKQSKYVPYTKSYRVMLEKKKRTKEDKKD